MSRTDGLQQHDSICHDPIQPACSRYLAAERRGSCFTVYHTDPPSDDRYHLMDARANGETVDVVDGHRYDSDHGANVR